MFELVHEYPELIRAGGTLYRARAYGDREDDGVLGGYLVFVPVGRGRVLGTPRETTQSTVSALQHWARMLSWVYLEGALARALESQPEVQLSRRLAEIEELEARALDDAAEFERAAESARTEAVVAREEREILEGKRARAIERAANASAAFHEQAAAQARAEADAAHESRAAYEKVRAAAHDRPRRRSTPRKRRA